MPKKTMPRNCLTCKYASEGQRDIIDSRTAYVKCGYPMPEITPPTWSYTSPYISYYDYDVGSRGTPYLEVIHAEYYNETYVEDCPCYRRGKNDLDWHRVPQDAEEE